VFLSVNFFSLLSLASKSSCVPALEPPKPGAKRRGQRADERTRTADLLSLRVIIVALQGFARACGFPLSKVVSLLCLARYCNMLRSQWCQRGVRSSWITRHRLLCARYASRDGDRQPATDSVHARLLPPPALQWTCTTVEVYVSINGEPSASEPLTSAP
jgi:hypothetical protein